MLRVIVVDRSSNLLCNKNFNLISLFNDLSMYDKMIKYLFSFLKEHTMTG